MNDAPRQPLFTAALHGIFAALGSDAIQKILGLVSTLIILSTLKPYDYGLWQLVLSVLTAFDVLLLSSIGSMLIADVSREIGAGEHGRAGTILRFSVPLFIGLGVMAALIMSIAAPFIEIHSGIGFALPLQIIALSLIAEGLSQGYQLVLQGTLDLVHAQGTKVLRRAGYVAALFILVFFMHAGLIGIVMAYTISIFVPLIIYGPIVLPRYLALTKEPHTSSIAFFEAAWERGRWSLAGDLISAATASFSPWFIGYYLSIADVGYISLTSTVLGQVSSLAPVSFVLRSILPRTLGVAERTRAWLARSMKYAVWSQALAGLAAAVGVYFVVPIFFPSYRAVIPLVAALIATLPIQIVGVVASEWFFAAKRQRALFFLSNLPKVILLALLPLFLATLGLTGYVLWSFLSTDILTYLRLRLVAKEGGGRISLRDIARPDAEDRVIFSRILDAVSKIRYTRS